MEYALKKVSKKVPQNKITPPYTRQNLATLTLAAIRENAFYEQYVSISLITSPSHRLCPDTNNPLGVENDDTRYITSCYAPPSPRSTNKWAEGRELFSTLAPLLYSFPQFIQSIPSGIVEFVSMLKLVLLLIKKIKVTWMPNWLSKSCLYRNKDHLRIISLREIVWLVLKDNFKNRVDHRDHHLFRNMCVGGHGIME